LGGVVVPKRTLFCRSQMRACVRAYVCASAVPPQLQSRRNNDSDTTVGGKAKSTTHTPVPEALYQIEMLARIRELRESSQGHDNDSSR
jgi:hypothetical protein